MKTRLLFISVLLISFFTNAQDVKFEDGAYKEYYKNGKLKTEGFHRNNKRVGLWKRYYENAQLSSQLIYDNKGNRTGVSISYFEDGGLKRETKKAGNGVLFTKEFNKNGNLFCEYTQIVIQDKKWIRMHGFYKEYYENEMLKIECNYENSELNGIWNRFYASGEKEWEVQYFNGAKHGSYKQYHKNNKLKLEGKHIANLKQGEENRYKENGTLEWKGIYLDNKFEGVWSQYDDAENIMNQLKYKKGKLKKADSNLGLFSIKIPEGHFEKVPVFPGCENLIGNAALKKCMSKKMAQFVNKKFNTKIANKLGLVGRQRINVIFKIDKTGNVIKVRARAPHKDLEEEAIRVVKQLPQIKPGMQRGKAVIVPYSLPIVFQIPVSTKNNQKDAFGNPMFTTRN